MFELTSLAWITDGCGSLIPSHYIMHMMQTFRDADRMQVELFALSTSIQAFENADIRYPVPEAEPCVADAIMLSETLNEEKRREA